MAARHNEEKNNPFVIGVIVFGLISGCAPLGLAGSAIGGVATGVKIDEHKGRIDGLELRVEELERKIQCPHGC